MIVRSLDENGDFTYGKGINNYKTYNDAIAQSITTRLKSFLGDCFFATDQGIDWWNLLGSKNTIALNLAVSATILKTSGVTGIKQLNIILDRLRNITIQYEVTTIYTGILGLGSLVSTTTYLLTEDGDFLTTEDGDSILA